MYNEIEVLKQLKRTEDYVSSALLCKELNVTRTSIWKYINKLRNRGYKIESATNKGYKLINVPDILSYEEVEAYLKTKWIGRNIKYFKEVTSTNDLAHEYAKKGIKNGSLIIAEYQSEGRGKQKIKWHSERQKGIWMSLIIYPNGCIEDAKKIHNIACEALQLCFKELGIKTNYKFPNAIMINGKKVSGVLTEVHGEIDNLDWIVVGIGINCFQQNFNKNIKNKSTSLYNENYYDISRKKIIAVFAEQFEKLYTKYIN